MSMRVGDLDYACARIAARFGARPDAATWRRIETVRDLAAMLDAARLTVLRPWTARLSAEADPHAIERAFRAHWRSLAAEVVAWMPGRWQPVLEWTALASELSVLGYLQRGERTLRWFVDDPVYRRWNAAGEAREAGAPGALASARDGGELLQAWRVEWRRRLPRSHADEAPLLAPFVQLIDRYVSEARVASPGDGSAAIGALRERLERLFRRAMLEPTAAFAYLALAGLDLMHLRAETLRRLLFPRLAPAP